MNIPLYNIIQINYPTGIIGLNGNIQLIDYNDGNGPFISEWNVPNVEQPTVDQLNAFQTDANTIQQYTFQQNKITNAPIYAQLDQIDIKSVRALREADPTYLVTLTSQAVALRAQLLPTS